jgi:hypothetical protein
MDHAADPARRLALIELFERDGRAGRTLDVQAWPLSLGRALDNDLVLDDPHVAPHHARIVAGDDGTLRLEVLDTRNGVGLDNRHLGAGGVAVLPAAGAALYIGGIRLRLRLPGEVLAPEKALPGSVRGQLVQPLAAGAALLALQGARQWLSLDPGADSSVWLPLLAGLPLALAAWCGLWALMSKLFQHRFDFGGHLRLALPRLLLIATVEALLPQIAAALALPLLWYAEMPVQAVLGVLLLRAHLLHVLPAHRRTVTASLAVLALAAAAVSLTFIRRSSDSWTGAPYMSTLPMPALRLGGSVPPQELVQAMAPLADRLAQRVKRARDETEAGDDEGTDAAGE